MEPVLVEAAEHGDAGEILTVQRAAYVSEAQLYLDAHIAPLTESLEEIRAAIAAEQVLVARSAERLVGAVRGVVDGDACHVGRLVVVPDLQGRGIGTELLAAVEREYGHRVRVMRLFTGHRSTGNLRLYERCGYAVSHTEQVAEHLSFVHLSKELAA